jgi:hypothetical protein
MPINPAISLGVKPLDIQMPNALAQAAQVMQLRQAQAQIGESEALAEERNKLRQLNPNAPDYESQLFRVNPQLGIQYRKERTAAESAEATRQKALTEATTARQALLGQAKRDISQRPSDANIMAYLEDIESSPLFTPEEKAQTRRNSETLLQMPLSERSAYLASQGAKAGELRPHVTAQTTGATNRILQTPAFGGAATVVPGSEVAVTPTQAQLMSDARDRERIKLEGQRLGLEGRRVAVLEENQRRDADPVFQQRMEAAKATGQAIAKGDVAAQQALPKIISRAEEGLRLIDEMVGKQEVRDKNGKVIQAATKPHPGFENAVGTTWLPGARFVDGTDAADFMSRFNQIKGASFLEAFESLKGGGAITEKEGAKGTDAINRMSTSQSEKEFLSAARDLQEVIRKGVANAQRKAATGGGAPAAAPAAAGGVKFLGFE